MTPAEHIEEAERLMGQSNAGGLPYDTRMALWTEATMHASIATAQMLHEVLPGGPI